MKIRQYLEEKYDGIGGEEVFSRGYLLDSLATELELKILNNLPQLIDELVDDLEDPSDDYHLESVKYLLEDKFREHLCIGEYEILDHPYLDGLVKDNIHFDIHDYIQNDIFDELFYYDEDRDAYDFKV